MGGDDPLARTSIPSDVNPSEAVISAVATFEDVEPTELDVLHDAIDPEALDQLVSSEKEVEIVFPYSGYEISLRGTDVLILREARGDD